MRQETEIVGRTACRYSLDSLCCLINFRNNTDDSVFFCRSNKEDQGGHSNGQQERIASAAMPNPSLTKGSRIRKSKRNGYLQKIIEQEQQRVSRVSEEDLMDESYHRVHINDMIMFYQNSKRSSLGSNEFKSPTD